MVFGEREFMFHDIVSMSLLYFGKSFLFTCPDGYFGLTGENYHAWKTDRLCRIYKIKQQSCHKIAERRRGRAISPLSFVQFDKSFHLVNISKNALKIKGVLTNMQNV